MKCISPITGYHPTQKGLITYPCGKCLACLNRNRNQWTFRLTQERKDSKSAKFITLTYDEENMILGRTHPTLYKPDLQNFIKKLRKSQSKISQWKIKYYAVGEYGTETQRPHYHAIIFNVHPIIIKGLTEIWNKGITHIGNVSPASIRYLTKYVINKSIAPPQGSEKPFNLISNKIGARYIKIAGEYHVYNQSDQCRMDNGSLIQMPRYFKEKIFTDYELQEIRQRNMNAMDQNAIKLLKKYGREIYKKEVEILEHKKQQFDNQLNKNNKI